MGDNNFNDNASHNQIRVGIACDLYDDLYLKTAMIDKKEINTMATLPRASFVNVDITKTHVFKVERDKITFEPASESNIKTYKVYDSNANIVISVMRYNQHVDMLILSE